MSAFLASRNRRRIESVYGLEGKPVCEIHLAVALHRLLGQNEVADNHIQSHALSNTRMSKVVELLERTIPRTVAFVYSTYLGGSGEDGGSGIAVDTDDNAYVTGVTFGSGFPGTASRSIQSTFGGGYYDDQSYDAFVAMITTHAKHCVNFLGDPSRKTGQAVMEWERGQAGLERDILAAGMRSYSK